MFKQIALCLILCRVASCETGHGYVPIFSATAGTGIDVLGTWRDVSANSIIPNGQIFKSPLVEQWGYKVFREVKISVLRNGVEKAYFIFNGLKSTKDNWMSEDRLLASSSGGLIGQTFRYFSIPGDLAADRHFFICRSYAGCGNDDGWLVAVDNGTRAACAWMERAPKPYFLYCDGETPCKFTTAPIGDQLVISVKMDD